MKQRVIRAFAGVLFPVLLLLCCFGTAGAEEKRVFDQAALFTGQEIAEMEAQIVQMQNRYNVDFVVVTTYDAQGKSARDYADDYYDYGGFGVGGDSRGVLFLIDMDNREAWISTTGAAVNILTDGRIDDILDEAYVGLSEGEYAEAAFAFLENADIFMRQGVPDGQYQYDSETGQMVKYRSLTLVEILVAVVISLGAGFLCCVAVWRRYRMKSAEEAYPFRQNAKLLLTRNEDRFINKSLSSVVVQNTSSSSGGRSSGGRSYTRSTTHRSSSGRSHGGGGRRF